MKIILSPSKTQNFTEKTTRKMEQPFFKERADQLVEKIQEFSREDLGQIMNIKGNLLENTYENYQTYESKSANHAIYTYTGLVYKYMDILDYGADMLSYLEDHLCILSALYGVLQAFDGINEYRLDMKMSIMEESLYTYWREAMVAYFNGETILNLASEEFSKMIPLPMITVGFRECKDGKYKNVATYSKMARGMLLDYMIKHQVTEIDTLKTIRFEGYHYKKELSNENTIIFARNDK